MEKYLSLSPLHGRNDYIFYIQNKRFIVEGMKRIRKKLPIEKAKIAQERIKILLDLAKKELKKHPKRSRRYVELARKIGLRCNVRLTKDQKEKFCKKCNQFLIPKKTSEVKLDPQKKLKKIKCLNCGYVFKKP